MRADRKASKWKLPVTKADHPGRSRGTACHRRSFGVACSGVYNSENGVKYPGNQEKWLFEGRNWVEGPLFQEIYPSEIR